MKHRAISLSETDIELVEKLADSLGFPKGYGRLTGTLRASVLLSTWLVESGVEIPEVFRGESKRGEEQTSTGRRIGFEDKERADVMVFLRTKMGWPLNRIGKKFGISRERVRQIVGNTGRVESVEKNDLITDIKAAEYGTTDAELATELGVPVSTISRHRAGMARRISNENSKGRIGQIWEEWTADMLTKMGMACQLMPPKNRGYDLLVNGFQVDVKVARSGGISPSLQGRMVNPAYSFGTNKIEGEEPIDFYCFIIAESEDMFIVPYGAVPSGTIQVRFCWPTARPTMGKYQKYHNRFDLLTAGTPNP